MCYLRVFKSGMELESFYNLLVKEITATENETAGTAGGNTVSIKMENRKDVIEISQKHKSTFVVNIEKF